MSWSKVKVRGVSLDEETRCAHYHTSVDIVAMKFYCCGRWYSCHACHEESESHPIEPWPASLFSEEAVLCGKCWHTISVSAYLHADHRCPNCHAAFNPGCQRHASIYFSTARG